MHTPLPSDYDRLLSVVFYVTMPSGIRCRVQIAKNVSISCAEPIASPHGYQVRFLEPFRDAGKGSEGLTSGLDQKGMSEASYFIDKHLL